MIVLDGFHCQPDEQRGHDEVETFVNARYISASEAYQFPIHNRKPAIEKLPCHLPNDQTVIFQESEAGNVADEGPPTTKLTDYFLLNQRDTQARTILYPDLPQLYTWNAIYMYMLTKHEPAPACNHCNEEHV